MKLAYLCEPQVGGTFTFFLRLRDGWQGSGHEVRCIPPHSSELFAGGRFAGQPGVDYLHLPEDLASASRVLIRHLEQGGFDAVMVLPGSDVLTTNLLRFIPRHIRTFARVPMATQGACRQVAAVADHLDGIVAVCDRIRDDLVADYGIAAGGIRVAYNGADTRSFSPGPGRKAGDPLHLLYSGRLEDVQKNVMMLPRLARQLRARGVPFRLTVVGGGPDREALVAAAQRAGVEGCLQLRASVPNAELPDLYRSADVFILPSRFEGCPNALLEAMACGCIPVVSHLRGSTDRIVEDGVSGLLCRVDDVAQFSDRVGRLAADEGLRSRLREGALARVAAQFTLSQMVARYASVLEELAGSPDRRLPALSLDRYDVPATLRRGWRAYVPDGLKKRARTLLGRWGKSI